MSSTPARTTGAYGAPPAPLGRRAAAWLLDGLLAALCGAALGAALLPGLVAAVDTTDQDTADRTPDPVLLVAGLVLLSVWGAVQWWCQGRYGWTIGRRILGLRTVDVRTGRPIGLGRAFVRYLVVVLGSLVCGVGLLVVLASILFDRTGRHRGWHDRVGDAIVVDVRGLAAARRVAAWDGRSRAAVPTAGAAIRGADVTPAQAGSTAESPAPGTSPHVPWSAITGTDVPHPVRAEHADALLPEPAPASEPEPTLAALPEPTLAAVPEPEPGDPTRTRWTALAAERQLGTPELVLPPLGTPGLAPDVDTRQTPTVPPAGFARPTVAAPRFDPLSDPLPDPAVPESVPPDPTPYGVPPVEHDDGRAGRHALRRGIPVHPDAVAGPPVAPVPPTPPVSPTPPVPPAPPASSVPPASTWLPPAPSAPDAVPPTFPVPPAPAPREVPADTFPRPTFGAVDPAGAPEWAVHLPDGSIVSLDGPLLVGRNPDVLPGVVSVAVDDPGRSVSKTHLMLGRDEHGPWVVDRGSTNGTFVTLSDGQHILCRPDHRVRLVDGSLVTFGDVSLSVAVRA